VGNAENGATLRRCPQKSQRNLVLGVIIYMSSRFVGEDNSCLAAPDRRQSCSKESHWTFLHGASNAYKLLQTEAEVRRKVAGIPVQHLLQRV
jgi:hypothetical protein